jgi:ABC-type transport system involved in multi-copper enzyme maturation permease subunit
MTTTLTPPPPAPPAADRPATFGDAVRSEWTKERSVRSTMWTVLTASVVAIGLGVLFSAVTANQYAKHASVRANWDPTGVSTGGLGLAQLAIVVLGVLFITSEYSSKAITTTLTAVPRRNRLLAAKTLVIAGISFVIAEVLTFVTFFIGQALISGHAPTASVGQPGVLRALVGAGLYGALIGVLGLALGAILRNAAAAIAIMVAVLYVLPGVSAALPASIEHTVEKFWPTNAGQQITNVVRGSHTLSPWEGLAVLAVFVAIVLAGGFSLINRRDA